MSSRITMILAGLFLFGAIIAGYWGLVLSRQPAELAAPAPASTPAAPVVAAPSEDLRPALLVLRRDVAANAPITQDDLLLEHVQVVPAGSFTTFAQALGRSPWRNLSAGTWLEESSFDAGGPLARMIQPGERALAFAIDEVSGAAGQLVPGDYVDVLVFLREESNNPQSSAQVVVPALRLLTVGQQLGLTNDGKPGEPDPKIREEQRKSGMRTVVLAVPEAFASQLVLAAQAGSLRLAVRSAEEQRLAHYWADPKTAQHNLATASRDLYRFSQLAQTPTAAPVSQSGGGRRGMEIIRGAQSASTNP
ncbi:Flp pilus assembly protein CpaB [Pseudomonas fontis]|uniref:Flp pilus assembly protein CpaB n=1 Tax=Pseudomonas fontis TaxID=2942633 RepID=A0ABT5P0M1_9PSED|nr:Flp pilus assembly protein CpaB [Pseudomonas fontis]MDD0977599.1 Flp pilus assembly protein CpaB [Pseudomonas fontis]MDD0993917.1 Flp pilus assembly protein CpaB [Pseudomonas fontis]